MQSDDGQGQRNDGVFPSNTVPSLAALATDLSALVDRFEADWKEHGIVAGDLAEELHELLKRAQHICGLLE